MLTYDTNLPSNAPYTSALKGEVQRAFRGKSPFRGNAADVYRGAAQSALANVRATGTMANSDYLQRFRDAQQKLVLGGLQNMSGAQQDVGRLGNERLSGITGLLSGLFS